MCQGSENSSILWRLVVSFLLTTAQLTLLPEIINEFSKVEDDEKMPLEELCHPCYVKMINMRSTSFAWPSLEDPGGEWWPKQLKLVKEKCSGTESKKDASYLDEKESAEEETTSVTPHKTASADDSGVGPMPTASTSSTDTPVSGSAAPESNTAETMESKYILCDWYAVLILGMVMLHL